MVGAAPIHCEKEVGLSSSGKDIGILGLLVFIFLYTNLLVRA